MISPNWDSGWRTQLVDNLEVLTRQLWQVGITEVFADSAYRGKTFREAVRIRGGSLRVAVTGMWGRDEAEMLARLEAWNQPIHRIRGRIEKIFGTWKRSYGLRRMRWRGLAKARLQIRFTAIVYNIKRCSRILAPA